MKQTIDTYPVFDANQVLTDDHLNTVVKYLDEQERLTRTNLVGIGISCGLGLTLKAAAVAVTRGCAVTSLGYLIVEQDDVELTAYRRYSLPKGDAYPPFKDGAEQLPLWEMFPDGEPEVEALDDPQGFLSDKSVLLFLERNSEDLADCSPNNCDDKGSAVTATVRRLLVRTADLARIAAAQEDEADDSARRALPELRQRRYDVPRTNLVTSREVLTAFQDAVRKDGLVSRTRAALESAYSAYRTILARDYPSSPFPWLGERYGFLEHVPEHPRQVAFLQYYVDLFSDLIAAYDEFRRKGLAFACKCCPSKDGFQRHVVLGPGQRTRWRPAAASCCGCEEQRTELLLLFRRLVELGHRFTDQPALLPASANATVDEQIRITPSRAGAAELSERCIPYYFEFTGDPPLYRLWNPALTRLGRAHHNLGYRFHEYSPQAPESVSAALTFDIERCDFLRIEGHLGKDYRSVVGTLAAMRKSYRLPFEVVAVRTGQLDEAVAVDPEEHACHFMDLEAQYRVLREEVTCLAKKAIASLGQTPLKLAVRAIPRAAPATIVSIPLTGLTTLMGRPLLEVEKMFAFPAGSMGATFFEGAKTWGTAVTLPTHSAAVNSGMSVLAQLADFAEVISTDLQRVDWYRLEGIWERLRKLSEMIAGAGDEPAAGDGLTWKQLRDQVISVVYACRMEAFKALRAEYQRRSSEVRERMYFSRFVEEHPALQHRAGVPVGGTFVLVYHQDAGPNTPDGGDAYATAIRQLAGGTVIADFCLPYVCCSDCPPIQYVLPADVEAPKVEAPTFEHRLGCTDAGEGVAEVTVVARGGTGPYELVIGGDSQGIFPNTITVPLPPGTHTMQVSDSLAVAAQPRTVKVPEALTVEGVTYADDPAANTYKASFTITGGERPYVPDQGEISEADVVTVKGVPSGARVRVKVTDSVGCSVEAELEHKVEVRCMKPCRGEARRAPYPAWAPLPGKDDSYSFVKMRECRLMISEGPRTVFVEDLAQVILPILTRQPIRDANHASVMREACDALTRHVESRFAAQPEAAPIVFQYDDRRGALFIEWYACQSFTIDVDFELLFRDQRPYAERWSYAPEGTRVMHQTNRAKLNYSLESFGVVALNKCTNTEGNPCFIDVRGVDHKVSNRTLMLKAILPRELDPRSLVFHWRLDMPTPLFTARPGVPELVGQLGDTKLMHVRLLVTDRERRCWGAHEATILPGSNLPPIRSTRRRR